MNVLRNVLLTAFAASVLAGCQSTTMQRDCDIRKPINQKYWGGKCCDASSPGSPCYKGGGGQDKPNDPTPTPQ